MKVAIFSDLHLGFGYGTERFEDPFDAFGEALEKSRGSDLVLIAGDIFDSKNPTTDVLSKAMESLLDLRMSENGARLVEGINRRLSGISPVNSMGLPVVSLHGNHERRARGLVNPVQALEKAGLLIHLHCSGLVFEKDGERLAVQGMSAIPDQYAKETLKQWNPKPLQGAYNILMLHQVFSEFFQSQHAIPASILPEGFDLYVDGDIHTPVKGSYKGRPFIIAGSLIPTQYSRDETSPKGVWILNTSSGSVFFQPLERQRKFYFLEYTSLDREVMERDIERLLSQHHEKKPAIRVRLPKDFEWQGELEARYNAKALLSFRKASEGKPLEGVSLADHLASVEETASRLLRENLAKTGLPPEAFEHVFELLEEGKSEDALKVVYEAARSQKAAKTENQPEGKAHPTPTTSDFEKSAASNGTRRLPKHKQES